MPRILRGVTTQGQSLGKGQGQSDYLQLDLLVWFQSNLFYELFWYLKRSKMDIQKQAVSKM